MSKKSQKASDLKSGGKNLKAKNASLKSKPFSVADVSTSRRGR
ncbi:MAG: hypothetical protein WCV55_00170 [Candidatus Paceibacterota bacterium]